MPAIVGSACVAAGTAPTGVSIPAVMDHDGTVNDFLVTYLDSIDDRLLEYLDEDEELKLDAVQRLRFYTSALLEQSITRTTSGMIGWTSYVLVPAFVAAYGPEQLKELKGRAEFLRAAEEDDEVNLTEGDRAYLTMLEAWLDMYPKMRITE
ncbi:MAG: hypothetical protein ABSA65_20255 [Acidimicrobiales bacterium]|jgi:hypothetical protein